MPERCDRRQGEELRPRFGLEIENDSHDIRRRNADAHSRDVRIGRLKAERQLVELGLGTIDDRRLRTFTSRVQLFSPLPNG